MQHFDNNQQQTTNKQQTNQHTLIFEMQHNPLIESLAALFPNVNRDVVAEVVSFSFFFFFAKKFKHLNYD